MASTVLSGAAPWSRSIPFLAAAAALDHQEPVAFLTPSLDLVAALVERLAPAFLAGALLMIHFLKLVLRWQLSLRVQPSLLLGVPAPCGSPSDACRASRPTRLCIRLLSAVI